MSPLTMRRDLIAPVLVGLGMSALTLAIHFAPIWVTMLNQGAFTWDHKPLPYDFLVDCIREHQTVAAFAKRPLTSWAIGGFSALGITPATGFIAVGSLFFFLTGLLVFRSAFWFGLKFDQALVAQFIFHASPTILFAWFCPLFTYDEPIQYVALLIAIGAWWERRSWLFILAFTIALIARETSVLLTPSLLFLAWANEERSNMRIRVRSLALSAVPLVLYGAFLWYFLSSSQLVPGIVDDLNSRRDLISFNFRDIDLTAESLWYLYLVIGIPVFLLLRYQDSSPCTTRENQMICAFLIALALNSLVVFFFTQAREARLFALPLLLVWPLLGKALLTELERHGGRKSYLAYFLRPARSLLLLGSLVAIYALVRLTFPMSTGIQQDNPFHEYIAIQTLFMIACLVAPDRQVQQA